MFPIPCFLLTFRAFFCRIRVYKGKFRRLAVIGCCAAVLCSGCRRQEQPVSPTPTPTPVTDTTMRGVWLSYIELDEMLANGDPTTATAAIRHAMDVCADAGLNAVFFHARAHGDAYYPSAEWPPAEAARAVMAEGFDPLGCAVSEAHKRGLKLHAWLNPYRVGEAPATDGVSFEKNGVWYLAPNDPTARQSILDGVREILNRYAVDGIHFEDIPHSTDLTAWRQTQVDTLVSGVYGLCHQYDKVFGVSPMADIDRGQTEAYADVTRWMTTAGYIDYICPQLYTGFRHQTKPFLSLLQQWTQLPRRKDVKLYIGLALYKVGLENDPYAGTGADEWVTDANIISRQIEAVQEKTDGYVLFRYGNLVKT